jgi:hypothetical protein
MSKKIILPLLLLFSASLTRAQFTAGVKAGGNFTKENFSSDNFTTSFRPGFHAGLVARYILAEKMRIQAELLFSAEGTKEENKQGTKGEIKRNFVHLPVMLQYMIIQSLYAETGPQIAYLLSSKESFGGSAFFDIMQYYKKANLRWAIGAGYGLTAAIFLNARYSFSLSPINKEQVGGDKLKSQAIQLGIIYMLDK